MKFLVKNVLLVALVFSANILQAQLTNDLSAIEATTPLSADQVPQVATFYSAASPYAPPLPANFSGYPAWDLGGGIYLMDDLDPSLATFGGGFHAMDDSGPFPGGGGDGGDGGGFTNSIPPYVFPTNGLWLWITNIANQTVYANLNGGTDLVYEVYSKADLMAPSWDIETEVFPGINTNVMPFTVPQLGRTNLFLWARDWTGITSNGNTTPQWWFYYYFGTVDLSDTNLDSLGNTLHSDYENKADPNDIIFSLQATNYYAYTSFFTGSISLQSGTPYYEAVLINDPNTTDASWHPYTGTNIAVSLAGGNGTYSISLGLRGLPSNADATWQTIQVILDHSTPILTITNPLTTTVSQPMIQLQGLVNETLSKLTFDVSNALGIVTNQQGYWNPEFFDTNVLGFTTNIFQCYDVKLTNGLNIITLHATDLQGNTAMTNASFTLNYSANTNPPSLKILWPQNGMPISGTNFTLQAQVGDDTATVIAQITDANGNVNTAQGIVERNGLVWANNLPLAVGTNILTVMATDAAGNSTVTNLTLRQSGVLVTMDPLAAFNQTNFYVTGTISDPSAELTVNGVTADIEDDEGDWVAGNVPMSPTGIASFDIEIGDTALEGSQIVNQPQPPVVAMVNYQKDDYYNVIDYRYCTFGPAPYVSSEAISWSQLFGGTISYSGGGIDGDCHPSGGGFSSNLPSGYSNYSANWEWDDYGINYNQVYSFFYSMGSEHITTQTHVAVMPSGPTGIGQAALYLVGAQVKNEDTSEQLPASSLHFMNQVPGTMVMDVTNGATVWSQFLAAGPAGTNLEVTPQASINKIIYNPPWQSTNVTLQIFDANTGTNLSSLVNTVIVGQQMNLTCQLSMTNALLNNSMLTDFQWAIPGDAISNYVANGQSGTVYTNFPTTNSTAAFYWVSGASNLILQCSVMLNGVTIMNQAVFDVMRPTGIISAIVGPVAVDDNYLSGFALHYGTGGVVPGEAGVLFSNKYVVPLGNYNYGNTNYSFEWIQKVNSFSRQFQTNDGGGAWYERMSAFLTNSVLDDFAPYPQWTPDNSATIDAPAEILVNATNSIWKKVQIADSFTMWLMFKPADGQWVPLGSANWNWSGAATLNNSLTNGNYWSLTEAASNTPAISDSTVYPQWTDNIVNWQVIVPKP